MSAPARLPAVKRGDTWDLVLRWQQTDGTAVNLSGCAARMQVRDTARRLVAVPTTLTVAAADGEVSVRFAPAATRLVPPGEYRTDMEITFTDGQVLSSQTMILPVLEDITLEADA